MPDISAVDFDQEFTFDRAGISLDYCGSPPYEAPLSSTIL